VRSTVQQEMAARVPTAAIFISSASFNDARMTLSALIADPPQHA